MDGRSKQGEWTELTERCDFDGVHPYISRKLQNLFSWYDKLRETVTETGIILPKAINLRHKVDGCVRIVLARRTSKYLGTIVMDEVEHGAHVEVFGQVRECDPIKKLLDQASLKIAYSVHFRGTQALSEAACDAGRIQERFDKEYF